MRISDWSSDVCSSDLCDHQRHGVFARPIAQSDGEMGGIGNNHGSVDDRLPGRTVEQFILTATKHALQFRGAFGFLIFVLQVLLGYVEPLDSLAQLRRIVVYSMDEARDAHGANGDKLGKGDV